MRVRRTPRGVRGAGRFAHFFPMRRSYAAPVCGSHASMRSSLTPAATSAAVTSPLPQERSRFGRRCRVGRRARTGRATRAPRGRAPRERPVVRVGVRAPLVDVKSGGAVRVRRVRVAHACESGRVDEGVGDASVEETGSLRDGARRRGGRRFEAHRAHPQRPATVYDAYSHHRAPSTRATGVPRAPPRVHRAVRPMKNATGAQLTLLSSAKIPVARFRARRASSIVRTSFSTTNRRDASRPTLFLPK